jgi:hypothetical protein
MRKMRNLHYYLAIFILLVLTSCSSKKSDPGALMPKSTGLLLSVNMGSLHEKGKLAEFNNTLMFARANGYITVMDTKLGKIVNQIVNDASQTGIDIQGDMNLFVDNDGLEGGLILPVKDQSKLLTFVNSVCTDYGVKCEPEKINDYSALIKDGGVIAWNSEHFIVYSIRDAHDYSALKAGIDNLINQKPEESLSSQEAYKKFMAAKKDISLFVDADLFCNLIGESGDTTGIESNKKNIIDLFRDCSITYNVEFADDEIDLTSSIELSDKMKKIFDPNKILKSGISDKLLKIIPANSIAAYSFGVNVNEAAKGFKELLNIITSNFQNIPDAGKLNTVLAAIDSFWNKFDGDIIYSVNDYKASDRIINSGSPAAFPEPEPVITVGFGINDESALDGFLKDPIFNIKENNGVYSLEAEGRIFYLVKKNKMLVVTSDPNIVEYVEKGELPNNMTSSPYKAQLLKGNFGYANLDLQTYPESMKQIFASNQVAKKIFDKMDIFKMITFETDTKNNIGKGAIQLKKTNTNSFYAIIKMLDKIVAEL